MAVVLFAGRCRRGGFTSTSTPGSMPFRACACPPVPAAAAASRRPIVGIRAIRSCCALRRNRHMQRKRLEAAAGVEPAIKVLQTSALPLGYAAPRSAALDEKRQTTETLLCPLPRCPERLERLKGLEPSTFCMASRRSSQLSYSRIAAASIPNPAGAAQFKGKKRRPRSRRLGVSPVRRRLLCSRARLQRHFGLAARAAHRSRETGRRGRWPGRAAP